MLLLDRTKFTAPAGSLASVAEMLQGAVQLELSTVPPYLTGLFSLRPGANQAARVRVQSVVLEEMLHLALAANTLVAIGGDPQIVAAALALHYPGHLPNSIDTGLVVTLDSLTTAQVGDVFMAIERPDTTAILPGETAPSPAVALRAANPSYLSIGEFYQAIIDDLEALVAKGDDPFAEPRLDRQVDLAPWFVGELPRNPSGKVHDLATARYNLESIIRQGEGAKVGGDPIDPFGGADRSFAHYFKFGEIFYGRGLVPAKGAPSGWAYEGEPVPLDPAGVYRFPANARLGDYDAGSAAYVAGEAFYNAYLRLLNGLEAAWNGAPTRLDDALGTMYELKLLAQQVVLHPARPLAPDGPVAAPPFQR